MTTPYFLSLTLVLVGCSGKVGAENDPAPLPDPTEQRESAVAQVANTIDEFHCVASRPPHPTSACRYPGGIACDLHSPTPTRDMLTGRCESLCGPAPTKDGWVWCEVEVNSFSSPASDADHTYFDLVCYGCTF